MCLGAGNRRLAGFHRLAQRLQRRALEFRPFIQKQHAVMRQADLARPPARPTTHQGGLAGGMMRLAKGRAGNQLPLAQKPRHRMDQRQFQRLGRTERRQQPRQPRRQHGFARSRRAHHQQIVIARCRHLQRPLGTFLADHLREAWAAPPGIAQRWWLRLAQHLGATKMVQHLNEMPRCQHLDAAGPGRLRPLRRRADQPQFALRGAQRRRQHPRHRQNRAIERQFPKCRELAEFLPRDQPHRREHGERDGQVIMAALLGEIGRREVHHQPPRRQREAERGQRRAHPLPAFANRLIRHADNDEGGQTGGELHLHLHRHGGNPGECEADDAGGVHAAP